MGDGRIVEQNLAACITARRQAQLPFRGLQENVAPFGPGQLERDVKQRKQDFVKNAGSVQFAGGFEEDRQFFQIGNFVRNLNARNLAEKISGGIGGDVLGMKNSVNGVPGTKLQPVVAFKRFALNAFAIHEGSVLAALIFDEKLAVFGNDERMVAGDARIGDRQVFLHFAADRERRVVKVESALLVAVDEDQTGE